MTTDVATPSSFLRRVLGGLPVITWPAFERHDIDAYVTTREGGVSTDRYSSLNLGLHVGDQQAHVLANREGVAAALGADLDDFVFCEQVHRPSVAVITETERGRGAWSAANAIARTDALVTTVPGIVLAVMEADCVPLMLFDPVARVLACVHAGWGETVRGVTPAGLAVMRSLGSDPADVIAGIGPAIHPDRYHVGAEVVEAAGEASGDRVGQVVRPDGTGRWIFDLWRANTMQLVDEGVPQAEVHLAGLGTGPGSAFYSHRSEGPCGRFAAVARMREGTA